MSVWIGTFTVVPNEGNNDLDGAKGAVVNAVGFADSVNEFVELSTQYLINSAFEVIEVEDVELFDFKSKDNSKSVLNMAKKVKQDKSIELDTFYTFDE
jgi:hypothetical protein